MYLARCGEFVREDLCRDPDFKLIDGELLVNRDIYCAGCFPEG